MKYLASYFSVPLFFLAVLFSSLTTVGATDFAMGPMLNEGDSSALYKKLKARFQNSSNPFDIEALAVESLDDRPFAGCVIVKNDNKAEKSDMIPFRISITVVDDMGPDQPKVVNKSVAFNNRDFVKFNLVQAGGAQFKEGVLNLDHVRSWEKRSEFCDEEIWDGSNSWKTWTYALSPNKRSYETKASCSPANPKGFHWVEYRKSSSYLVFMMMDMTDETNEGIPPKYGYCW